MKFRKLYPALLLGLSVANCRTSTPTDSGLEAVRVGDSNTYIWVHNVISSEEIYNANNQKVDSGSRKPLSCIYYADASGSGLGVGGRNEGVLTASEMRMLFSSAKVMSSSKSSLAVYAPIEDIIGNAKAFIEAKGNTAAYNSIPRSEWDEAAGRMSQFQSSQNGLQSILERPMGGGARFATVFDRFVEGQKICRGGFFGLQENKACKTKWDQFYPEWQKASATHRSLMSKFKGESRLAAFSGCTVPGEKSSSDQYFTCQISQDNFLRRESFNTVLRTRGEFEALLPDIATLVNNASVDENGARPLSINVIGERKFEDGANVKNILTKYSGGLTNVIHVNTASSIFGYLKDGAAWTQDKVIERLPNPSAISSQSLCPAPSRLVSEGLWFAYLDRKVQAPEPVSSDDPSAWIPTGIAPAQIVGTNLVCTVPNSGIRATLRSTLVNNTAEIVLQDRRFFKCGFESGVGFDAGTILRVSFTNFPSKQPAPPEPATPTPAPANPPRAGTAASNGQEYVYTPYDGAQFYIINGASTHECSPRSTIDFTATRQQTTGATVGAANQVAWLLTLTSYASHSCGQFRALAPGDRVLILDSQLQGRYKVATKSQTAVSPAPSGLVYIAPGQDANRASPLIVPGKGTCVAKSDFQAMLSNQPDGGWQLKLEQELITGVCGKIPAGTIVTVNAADQSTFKVSPLR